MRRTTVFWVVFTAFMAGVSAHDVAVLIGVHIQGIHAIYYAVPATFLGLYLALRGHKKRKS